jgi:hypothetical protein
VTLAGELDLASAYAFDRRLLEIESRHPALVVVDLRGVTMLDSAGLGRPRVGAPARAGAAAGVRARPRWARRGRVLQTTRLDEHLEVTRVTCRSRCAIPSERALRRPAAGLLQPPVGDVDPRSPRSSTPSSIASSGRSR